MTDTHILRVADLPQNSPETFDFRPDAAANKALAGQLGLSALRKLRFAGTLTAQGKRDWELVARVGATVVQPCVVTLEPVTTRIETEVRRVFVANWTTPDEEEVELAEDDSTEPLGRFIDLSVVMSEALALALPVYPRLKDADLGEAVFTQPGIEPMRDEDARPFAGLSDLRASLKKTP